MFLVRVLLFVLVQFGMCKLYLSKNGYDTNDCSIRKPCRTYKIAEKRLVPGVEEEIHFISTAETQILMSCDVILTSEVVFTTSPNFIADEESISVIFRGIIFQNYQSLSVYNGKNKRYSNVTFDDCTFDTWESQETHDGCILGVFDKVVIKNSRIKNLESPLLYINEASVIEITSCVGDSIKSLVLLDTVGFGSIEFMITKSVFTEIGIICITDSKFISTDETVNFLKVNLHNVHGSSLYQFIFENVEFGLNGRTILHISDSSYSTSTVTMKNVTSYGSSCEFEFDSLSSISFEKSNFSHGKLYMHRGTITHDYDTSAVLRVIDSQFTAFQFSIPLILKLEMDGSTFDNWFMNGMSKIQTVHIQRCVFKNALFASSILSFFDFNSLKISDSVFKNNGDPVLDQIIVSINFLAYYSFFILDNVLFENNFASSIQVNSMVPNDLEFSLNRNNYIINDCYIYNNKGLDHGQVVLSGLQKMTINNLTCSENVANFGACFYFDLEEYSEFVFEMMPEWKGNLAYVAGGSFFLTNYFFNFDMLQIYDKLHSNSLGYGKINATILDLIHFSYVEKENGVRKYKDDMPIEIFSGESLNIVFYGTDYYEEIVTSDEHLGTFFYTSPNGTNITDNSGVVLMDSNGDIVFNDIIITGEVGESFGLLFSSTKYFHKGCTPVEGVSFNITDCPDFFERDYKSNTCKRCIYNMYKINEMEKCSECPKNGAYCVEGDIFPKEGWFLVKNSKAGYLYKCLDKGICLNKGCEGKRDGILCQDCVWNYTLVNNECFATKGDTAGAYVVFILYFFLFFGLFLISVHILANTILLTTETKIVIMFAQSLGVLRVFNSSLINSTYPWVKVLVDFSYVVSYIFGFGWFEIFKTASILQGTYLTFGPYWELSFSVFVRILPFLICIVLLVLSFSLHWCRSKFILIRRRTKAENSQRDGKEESNDIIIEEEEEFSEINVKQDELQPLVGEAKKSEDQKKKIDATQMWSYVKKGWSQMVGRYSLLRTTYYVYFVIFTVLMNSFFEFLTCPKFGTELPRVLLTFTNIRCYTAAYYEWMFTYYLIVLAIVVVLPIIIFLIILKNKIKKTAVLSQEIKKVYEDYKDELNFFDSVHFIEQFFVVFVLWFCNTFLFMGGNVLYLVLGATYITILIYRLVFQPFKKSRHNFCWNIALVILSAVSFLKVSASYSDNEINEIIIVVSFASLLLFFFLFLRFNCITQYFWEKLKKAITDKKKRQDENEDERSIFNISVISSTSKVEEITIEEEEKFVSERLEKELHKKNKLVQSLTQSNEDLRVKNEKAQRSLHNNESEKKILMEKIQNLQRNLKLEKIEVKKATMRMVKRAKAQNEVMIGDHRSKVKEMKILLKKRDRRNRILIKRLNESKEINEKLHLKVKRLNFDTKVFSEEGEVRKKEKLQIVDKEGEVVETVAVEVQETKDEGSEANVEEEKILENDE